MDQTTLANLALLPPIRRARNWRLYAENGRRFLDLWQDEGRGILGAKGTGIGTVAKAFVDKGLVSPLPSVHARRLEKAIRARWPGWKAIRLYADEASAFGALHELGLRGRRIEIRDPAREALAAARGGGTNGPASDLILLRPFAEALDTGRETGKAALSPAEDFRVAMLRLPCARALAPVVLLFREEGEAPATPLLPVPPFLLAGAAKALGELEGFHRVANEEVWRRADRRLSGLFERRGPWLLPRCAEADYGKLFAAALEAGVLISPDPALPSILPPDFDDGELMPLASIQV